jgi:trehalose utilization protein
MSNSNIRVTVWGENVHEQRDAAVQSHYPHGMHRCIADGLNEMPDIAARCATLQEPEHGLSEEILANTDVLIWWGHRAHAEVDDSVVERAVARVWQGMGLVVLHSAHYSKIFKRLMGTSCSLTWRVAGEKERLWVCQPGHPITEGLPPFLELPESEMYGEPFAVPSPDEQVFISWFSGGEVFRSGCTWQRGAGKIFYFSPGHEIYPIYHDPHVKRVLQNATRWAYSRTSAWIDACRQISREDAPEQLPERPL